MRSNSRMSIRSTSATMCGLPKLSAVKRSGDSNDGITSATKRPAPRVNPKSSLDVRTSMSTP